MSMNPDRFYCELGYLITAMPDFASDQWESPQAHRWLGRASALIEQSGIMTESLTFNVAVDSLCTNPLLPGHASAAQRITTVLYRALARAELQASSSVSGAFIPVGESFSAFTALARILSESKDTVMFVDPYADANLLTDFAVLVPEGARTHILADAGGKKAALIPALKHWKQQYGETRPVECRLAPNRTLHDRLIIIDERESWTLGQSFNALAARAPTSLVRADFETARLKIQAHLQIWQTSSPVEEN